MKDICRSSKDEDVKQFVNFIQTQEPSEICSLKSSKKDILIPSGKSAKVSFRANTSGLDKRTPVIFEPDEAASWPDALLYQKWYCVLNLENHVLSVWKLQHV